MIHPNSRAGIRSSEVSRSRTPPSTTAGIGRKSAGGENPGHHLGAAAPRAPGHRFRRARPGPRLGGFAVAVLAQRALDRPSPCPMSSDSPGSVTSSRSPVSRAARSDSACTASTSGPGPRWTWVEPPWNPATPLAPEPVEEVGVVAVAQEGLRVGADQVRVEVRDHRDLVLASDRGQHRPDLRVAERRVQVVGPVPRGAIRGVGSWGTRPAPARSPRARRSMACSCTAGATPGRRRTVTRRQPCLPAWPCAGRRWVAASRQSTAGVKEQG